MAAEVGAEDTGSDGHQRSDKEGGGKEGVRLKLAFCMTCAVCILVLAQGPSF